MRLVKEITTKKYSKADVVIEEIAQYYYDSEAEKKKHLKVMSKLGFTDNGQVKENVGSIMNPKYVWFGSYYKYDIASF